MKSFNILFALIVVCISLSAQGQSLYGDPVSWERHEQWKDSLHHFLSAKYTLERYVYSKEQGSTDIEFRDKEKHRITLELYRDDSNKDQPVVGKVYVSGYGDEVLRFYQQYVNPQADIAKIRAAEEAAPFKKGPWTIKLIKARNEYGDQWSLTAGARP